MIVRSWPRTVLKVVLMAATMCSGVAVAKHDLPGEMKGKPAGYEAG